MGGKSETLATLYPSALLVQVLSFYQEEMQPVLLVNKPMWIFEFDRNAHNNLSGVEDCGENLLLITLPFQLRNADDRLVALKLGGSPLIPTLIKFKGALEGYQG